MIDLSRRWLFANRNEWRTWLEENHATANEAWLFIKVKTVKDVNDV